MARTASLVIAMGAVKLEYVMLTILFQLIICWIHFTVHTSRYCDFWQVNLSAVGRPQSRRCKPP